MTDKILIIDDEPDILESLEVMLEKQGYEVSTALSGFEGLEIAKEGSPDLILLDVMMPEMDGFETCKKLRAGFRTKAIPVLLLTALHDADSKVKGLDAGADDFITKPFNDAELKARVRAFVRTKRMRDELEENYMKLKELEQMRDLLTHTMVHDLKTPLTSIKGTISVLMDQLESKGPLGPEHIKLLRTAQHSSDKILSLIQDILDVSRMEEKKLPVQKKSISISQVAQECLDTIMPLALQNGFTIHNAVPSSFPHIITDEEIFRRVLINLLGNSMKFTDRGGKISLELNDLSSENQIECVVEDSGIGIPKENLEKIFDKFFQGTNPSLSRRGQGLGLSFCRLAVEAIGGRIWAESEEGKGSRFIIRLPLS